MQEEEKEKGEKEDEKEAEGGEEWQWQPSVQNGSLFMSAQQNKLQKILHNQKFKRSEKRFNNI